MRVLIIDNEASRTPAGDLVGPDRNTSLLVALKQHHVDPVADVATDEIDVDAHIEAFHYSVVLVRWHVGVVTTVATLRRAHKRLAIIVLADDFHVSELRACLNAGADDYISPPIALVEVIARIHACVRRYAGHAQSLMECGCVTIDLFRRSWIVNDKPMHLPNSEYRILEYLVLANGRPVSKEELMYMLHGVNADKKDAKAPDVFIHHLRRSFRKAGMPAAAIGTRWSHGVHIDTTIQPRATVQKAA